MQILVIFLIALVTLVGCQDAKDHVKNSQANTLTVTKQKLETSVFYSGVIQPLKTIVITSPVDGIVEDMHFFYGQTVEKNQPLFVLNSEKFKTEYKTALMQYIKSKMEFNNSQSQLTEAKFLHKNALISEDDYKAKQTTFYTTQLSLMQAEDTLSAILKQLHINDLDLYRLSIKDIDKINHALHVDNTSQKVHITASSNGVVLLPIKNDSTEQKKVSKGDQVKQGDVLAMIGDVSGFMIRINVNEFNINQLHVGQKVRVTGNAFPQYILDGKIASIDRQAQASQGGVPIFPIEVVIPQITKAQQEMIHMGMSAKVDILMNMGEVTTIPLSAILEKENVPFVKLKKDNQVLETRIKTGMTTANAVVVENLQVGDTIVLPN